MNYMPRAVAPSQKFLYCIDFSISASSTGRYKPTSVDYVSKFYSLLSKWRSETYFVSSPSKLQEHQSFKEILELGEKVIPLILLEMKEKPSLIMMALAKISGVVPYDPSEKGDLKAMTDAWLAWGQRQGYDC